MKALTGEELEASSFVPGGEGAMESLETAFGPGMEATDTAFTIDPITGEAIQSSAQGGQVLGQDQLMLMLALAQMQEQETAYSGTPLEEVQPTIAEIFASKGKTLGGNNTQSLSQINEQFA